MKKFKNLVLTVFMLTPILLSAQCESWVGNSNEEEIVGWHSIYRQHMKSNELETAFDYWEKAYEAAPAADGKRDYHYMDGITLYKNKLKAATVDEEKNAIKATIERLYKEAIDCYKSRSITLSKCKDDACYDKRIAYILGRQGYDMYYEMQSSYTRNLNTFAQSVELGGNDTEYIVLTPYASIAVYQFQKEKVDKAQARAIHSKLNEIADYNIANNTKFAAQYEQSKEAMNAAFSKVERDIFDCDYFKAKMKPEYDADPDNPDVIKRVLAILKGQGCAAGDPMYDELDRKWKKYASVENAKIKAEFEQNNPAIMAKKMYDSGDFQGALNKYKQAISDETDSQKKSGYQFSAASILFRKLNKYSDARAMARDAAASRPNWGRPYMLIGDMYGKSARSCGDDWNTRLAIIAAMDKYNYAKSVDPSVTEDANKRISQYRSSLPDKTEGFMRKVKAGQSQKVGCWIGETVKVRYK